MSGMFKSCTMTYVPNGTAAIAHSNLLYVCYYQIHPNHKSPIKKGSVRTQR